jgi:hypothetical protein
MIGVMMYKVEIEKADGEIVYLNGGKEYDREFAVELCEFGWNAKAHTGDYASFRVVESTTGEVYSELEC